MKRIILLPSARRLAVRKTVKFLALAAVFLVFGLGLPSGLSETSLAQTAPLPDERPNMIIILTDDLDARSVEHMPALQSLLAEGGTTFSNAFVTKSLCCPSRASIFLGQYPHNHQVLTNSSPLGGYEKFRNMGHEESTIATWLHSGGYQTALIGNYFFNYSHTTDPVPPGWDEFESGGISDIVAGKANDYVRRAAEDGRPFFLYLAPTDPHKPYTPASRHAGAFAGEQWPRSPSFNEADVSDKPSWIRNRPLLTPDQIAQIDEWQRGRLRELLGVDDMIRGLVKSLGESGELENTYIVFSSDNGFHLGEHRLGDLAPNKLTAYEEDIRVPLIVRGPSVPAGRVSDQFALNIDLAPTFAELGDVTAPSSVDGRSLVPLLTSATPPTSWRSVFGVNGMGTSTNGSYAPAYHGLRTKFHKYVRYDNGQRELYDLSIDPYELENFYNSAPSGLKQQLESQLVAVEGCAGESCHAAEDGNLAPTADVTATPTSGDVPLDVGFDGSGSSDPDGDTPLTYLWDFGDGSTPTETSTPTTSHEYTTAGTYTAQLKVRDAHGAKSSPDTVEIIPGNDCTITGTSGNDTISGTSGKDVICGLGGSDTIKGLGGDDILIGGDGNDTLLGGTGNDTLDGGLGTDTGSYAPSLTAVNASLATNTATGEGSDTFAGVENLTGSSKADTLTGSATNNTLTGGGGDDTVRGGAGNDKVVGNGGADFLFGEDGSDTVNSKDSVNGNDSLDGGAGTDTKVTDTTEKTITGFP